MEEIENLEDLFKNIVWAEPAYTAVYDPKSGSLHCIGPKSVLENEKYTIDVDRETAEMIIEGKIKISSCFVDVIDNTFQIAEVKTAVKIDDVLHRVIEKQYADDEKIDLYIKYKAPLILVAPIISLAINLLYHQFAEYINDQLHIPHRYVRILLHKHHIIADNLLYDSNLDTLKTILPEFYF